MRDEQTKSALAPLVPSIFIPSGVYQVGAGALAAVLALGALEVGYSKSLASALLGVFGLIGVVSGPPIGALIARIGERTALVSAGLLAMSAAAACLVALHVPTSPVARPAYGLGVCLLAFGANVWSLGRQAYIAESLPWNTRTRALGFLGGMVRIGNLIGPGVGALAVMVLAIPGVFWLQILTTCVALAFTVAFTVPPRTSAPSAEAARPAETPTMPAAAAPRGVNRRSVALLGVDTVLLGLARANRNVLVALWGHHLGMGAEVISATFAVGAFIDVVMFAPSGWMIRRWGRQAGLLPTFVVMGVGTAMLVAWPTPAGFVVGACLLGLGNGFGCGIVMTMGADLSPDVGRARFLGYWQAVGNTGTALGPFLVSWLTGAIGLEWGVWVTAGLCLLAGAWSLWAVPAAYAGMGLTTKGAPLPAR